jgi:hypothetical protein
MFVPGKLSQPILTNTSLVQKFVNYGQKSVKIFAAWVSDMFCDLYSMKNHKVANTSTTTKARRK